MPQHELETDGPPRLSPDEERAVLAEQQIDEERYIEEATLARFQGHPETCVCVKCASVLLASFTGHRVTVSAPLESSPRVQRMLDASHEGTAA